MADVASGSLDLPNTRTRLLSNADFCANLRNKKRAKSGTLFAVINYSPTNSLADRQHVTNRNRN